MIERRELLRLFGLGSAAGALGMLGREAAAEVAPRPAAPLEAGAGLKITRVRAILTSPAGPKLVVVKVETSEPGLYGLGCATFTQRAAAVAVAVEEFLDPFARGRDPDNIEDIWQTAYTSSYWRNGPVLNNALSGLDMALWDIKGKRAGMPVCQLLGGKCRFAVETYVHCQGKDLKTLEDNVKAQIAAGSRNVRIQLGGYGALHLSGTADFRSSGFGMPKDQHMDAKPYLKSVPKMFEHIRNTCGDEVGLLHDIHERVEPIDAVHMIKQLEPYRPFFIEDPFSPEQIGYFKMLREQTAVPIAMGELFNNPHEWVDLLTGRLIDFVRMHISQVGGLSVARKIATLAEWFGVRTAWHGPGDVSPVGHAANLHLDLACHNFGIQEASPFNQATQDVFPGCPTMQNGYLHVNDRPGFGVDLDEKVAAKFPVSKKPDLWQPLRRSDGTAVRP